MPETNLEITGYYNEAIKLQQYAESRVIKTLDDAKTANDDLTIIARLKKAMETRRKEELKPIDDARKSIQDNYNKWMAPVLAADIITRDKMKAFNVEQERIRYEQEEINRKRMEAAEAEMKLKGEISEPVNLVEVAPEIKKVITELGTTNTMKVRKWEVIDFAAVPDDLKVIDAGKVTKLVKAGIGSIAGIRIYEESVIVVRPR